jgi:nicotinate (nicotinamide) nucleotide adenylyltransferase
MNKKRIGFYPGTFDPVHDGHIAFAMAAIDSCNLEQVIFLPENKPRGKHNVTDIHHRTELLRFATDNLSDLSVTVLEADKFTIDSTLPILQEIAGDHPLTILLGSDIAMTLNTWTGIGGALKSIQFAIGIRSQSNSKNIMNAMGQIETQYMVSPDYVLVETPLAYMSSTQIKQGNICLGTPAMEHYASLHHLYSR